MSTWLTVWLIGAAIGVFVGYRIGRSDRDRRTGVRVLRGLAHQMRTEAATIDHPHVSRLLSNYALRATRAADELEDPFDANG